MSDKKRVVLVGGAGYVGSTLVGEFLANNYRVKVIDRLFFGLDCLAQYRNEVGFTLVRHDSRYVDREEFAGAHAVIDLAGIANDPACELDENATRDINLNGSLRVAQIAREVGARLIFSSSCSVYGRGQDVGLTEESECRPVSLYARLKLEVENELREMAEAHDGFVPVMLRNATVYGVSQPRTRFDLVVNLMTSYALEQRKIYILGGGRQWRPLVHVKDLARAFRLFVEANADQVRSQAFNVGSDEQNMQVSEIAMRVAAQLPGTDVEYVPDDPDKRTYNVRFDKIKELLDFVPRYGVDDGIKELIEALRQRRIVADDIRAKTLHYYRFLIDAQRVVREVELDGRIL